jgi:D-cysteine desulfhydrase family pyridoxal phosphate-dependent enzyme
MLDRFPRAHLAHLPTPLEPLTRLSRHLAGPELWIKRDDQTGLATGGNKARKLEFLLGDALQEGADLLITTGGPQSNHCRQTAAAAARLGLPAILALTGDAPAAQTGNLLLDDLLGAEVRWMGDVSWWELPARIEAIAEEQRHKGRRPYVIPLGGSAPLGALGYVAAMQELMAQCAARQVAFDRIIIASSSAGTQSGMLIGAALFGFVGQITAVSIGESAEELRQRVEALVPTTLQLLGQPAVVDLSRVQTDDRYLGAGYAIVGEAEREAVRLLARSEGILVGPVYTGRALAGMLDMIRRGEIRPQERVLFWHTGDTAAIFAFSAELSRPAR